MDKDYAKAVRKKRYNACKQLQIDDLLINQYWGLAIFLDVTIAIALTIGIIANNNPPMVSLIAIIATWLALVANPILFVYVTAAYNCRPLLKYDTVTECEEACKYWPCFNDCMKRAKTEKDREWCDNYCTQRYQSCIKRCNNAFKAGETWY